jgi:hypothetical protein
MVRDAVQLLIWAVVGIFITWGIFFAYVGFKTAKNGKRRRLAKVSEIMALALGIIWIFLWVSAVLFNFLQIIGVVHR